MTRCIVYLLRKLKPTTAVCVGVCVGIVYFGIPSRCVALNLETLKVCFLAGDYKAAITEGEKILASVKESRQLDELYYILGLSYMKDGNYLRASDIFEIILNEFHDSRLREQAQLGLADTLFLREDFVRAQNDYEELLKRDQNTHLKAQLFYRLSKLGFRTGDTETGKEYAQKLKNEFPHNSESEFAADFCPIPRSASEMYYSVQVGAFSEKKNADTLTQKLLQKGYPAFIEESYAQAKTSYRVRVGKANTRQEAIVVEKQLAQEGYPTRICP